MNVAAMSASHHVNCVAANGVGNAVVNDAAANESDSPAHRAVQPGSDFVLVTLHEESGGKTPFAIPLSEVDHALAVSSGALRPGCCAVDFGCDALPLDLGCGALEVDLGCGASELDCGASAIDCGPVGMGCGASVIGCGALETAACLPVPLAWATIPSQRPCRRAVSDPLPSLLLLHQQHLKIARRQKTLFPASSGPSHTRSSHTFHTLP